MSAGTPDSAGRLGTGRRRLVVAVLAITLVNLAVRGVWTLQFTTRPVSDFAIYYGSAARWAGGGGFTLDGVHATVAWPPGWPLLLRVVFAATGPSIGAATALQVVLSSLTAGLVVVLGRRAFGSLAVGVLAGILFTAQPSSWARDAVLGTEPLFGLLVTAGVLALVAWCRPHASPRRTPVVGAVLTGLAWGAATLVRGTQLLAFPLVGLVILARGGGLRRALIHTGLAAAALVVVVAPWTIRNAVVTGAFVPVSSNLGVNLWLGTRADTAYAWIDDPARNPALQGDSEVDADRHARDAALDYWRAHPAEWFARVPARLAGLYGGNDEAFWWLRRTAQMTGPVEQRWVGAANLAYWCVAAFALTGGAGAVALVVRDVRLRQRARVDPGAIVALLGTVAYTTALFTWFPAWDRFRAPLLPLLCVLAAYGMVGVVMHTTDRSEPESDTLTQSPPEVARTL